jgi:hypothetical protein
MNIANVSVAATTRRNEEVHETSKHTHMQKKKDKQQKRVSSCVAPVSLFPSWEVLTTAKKKRSSTT